MLVALGDTHRTSGHGLNGRTVSGNNDESTLVTRLPSRTVFSAEGLTVAVVHGHERSAQRLSLLGGEVGAELVITGHSHRPAVESAGELTLLNPGSHAAPRQFRPAHAELERTMTWSWAGSSNLTAQRSRRSRSTLRGENVA